MRSDNLHTHQNPEKLYVVVRNDLSPGSQIAQSIHAFREYVEVHFESEAEWYATSNTIVVLKVENELELKSLSNQAFENQILRAEFREPAMNMSLTAVAFEPGPKTSYFLSNLSLAGT